ncbi:OmpA family protein [Endomicrobium proavitum]|uniref:Putative outer membrane lipoprotein n=1 Tax=Endomicrobium proavitum TaxID=1408281 RepID=A0A0G3WGC4_9BACT|nr:OmpA family protein [Endomicrobium proavitum]AKL97408.1 putative outer membrane lipoprotein [Endomicrobium proavitum]
MNKVLLTALGFCLLAAACTTPGKNTAIGAGAGAAVGAVTGAVIANNTKGGEAWKGAVIGGAAGAVAGGAIGNYFDKQAKELAAIADVAKTNDGLRITLKNDILFSVNSAELSSAAQKTLTDLNTVLKKYPQNIIVVEGNTDNTGSAATNKTLSEKRAKAVYDFLLGTGLKTYKISYIGYGLTNPIADNSTEEGRAKNRRVNLDITANTAAIK